MYTILIIEDEPRVASLLMNGLEENGYQTMVAYDGLMGLRLFQAHTFNLVISDIVLPKMDGFELAKEIRKSNPNIPILMLTALGSTNDKLDGFDAGADDYMVKPFDFRELEARVRSLLRRDFTQHNTVIPFGCFRMDTQARLVFTEKGEEVCLTPKEFSILEYLLLNQGRAVSPEELIEHVWESDDCFFSNAVKVHMSTLRKKLGEFSGQEIIINIRGAGYSIKK